MDFIGKKKSEQVKEQGFVDLTNKDSLNSMIGEIRQVLSRYRAELDYTVKESGGVITDIEITAKIHVR